MNLKKIFGHSRLNIAKDDEDDEPRKNRKSNEEGCIADSQFINHPEMEEVMTIINAKHYSGKWAIWKKRGVRGTATRVNEFWGKVAQSLWYSESSKICEHYTLSIYWLNWRLQKRGSRGRFRPCVLRSTRCTSVIVIELLKKFFQKILFKFLWKLPKVLSLIPSAIPP